MTDTTTKAVERLMKDVTPGPWANDGGRYITAPDVDFPNDPWDVARVYALREWPVQADGNAAFIAAARELVPALLADRDRLAALLAASQSPDPVTNADSCQPTPVSVQEAAKVLLGNRAVLDRMVDVAEDIHGTGVSFNRVVGDALRAIAEGGEA